MSASGPPSDDATPVERGTGVGAVASGESPNPGPLVVGREAELREVRALLADAAAGRCRALLVEGDPGVGKTTLLEAARSLADGFTVLGARGVEPEAGLAHAGLLELLHPVRDLVAEVPDAQAAALRSALGWSAGPAEADGFLVAAATLSLLAARAERGPVLVLVDDLQWLDRESAAAVLFAARRLGPDRVAFLLAARAGSVPAEQTQGLPVLRLGGLGAPEAAALLPAGTAPPVLAALVAGTAGNPLALLEAGRRLDDAQRIGAAPLPDPLPVADRLQRLYRGQLADLSPATRQAVLLLALSGTGDADLAAVATVLGAAGVDPAAAWDEADGYGVLTRDGARHRFRHPLLRSTVLETAGTADRMAAHAALADALPAGHRARVWHRAGATTGTDAAVAEDLARRADADRDHLGHAAASLALERAAALTPDPALAARRLAGAAQDAFLAGDVDRVRALVDRVLADGAPDDVRGDALLTVGTLEQYAGSVPRSVEHLARASTLLTGATLVRALAEEAMARFRLNDVAGFADCAHRIDRVADPDDPEQRLLADFCGGVAAVLAGDFAAGAPRLAEVRRLADLPALRTDPRALLLTALAAGFTGEVHDAVTAGAPRVDEVRRRGAIGLLVPLLAVLAAGRAWLGDHAGAFADAGEAAELGDHLGYAADASVAVEMLAWQQAARGLHDDARASLERARALTDRAGTTSAAAHQALTAAFCALCRSDLPAVVDLLEGRLAVDGGVGATGEALGVAPLLVEAYAGLGRSADALALAARYAEVTPAAAPPLSVALVHRCRGLTAPEEHLARAAFDAALEAHALAWDPFETARTKLLLGSRLRRAGQRVAAREHLAAARDAFTAMDLGHWSALAAEELAATGATARRRTRAGDAPLTSQETRVALLAARGLSNKEIGASLFLSPRTVERHLGNVFRKRGFRTRTELAVAFARDGGAPRGGG